MKDVHRKILLNPGPATTTDRVKWAQVVPDICPRENQFVDLMKHIRQQLVSWVADVKTHDAVLFGASGTGALESVLTSISPETVLIINNGAYGVRMLQILKTYGIASLEFKSSSTDCLNFEALESMLKQSRPTHVAMVHHETSTGLLNDIAQVGSLCKKHSATFIVDAISSYGAIPIDVEAMGIDYLIATSNKNIQGMPGCAFVISAHHTLQNLSQSKSYYFDLGAQYKSLNQSGQTRFTPPVQVLYSLAQALDELKQEGLTTRYQRYSQLWDILMSGLAQNNLETLVPVPYQSKLITAIKPPAYKNYRFQVMHDYFYERDFTIYPGKLDQVPSFRVANIGAIYPDDMHQFISLLGEYISTLKTI